MQINPSGIALFSALLIGTTVVLATSRPSTPAGLDDKKPKQNPVHATIVPHDESLRKYLTSVGSFMEVPPRDGRFGASRVPTIHGQMHQSVPGYSEIKQLGAKYDLVSGTFGELSSPSSQTGKQPRVGMIHRVNGSGKMLVYNTIPYDVVIAAVSKVAKSPADDAGFSASITELDKTKLNVIAKTVKAPDDSCSKCHAGRSKGDTIGHVFAAFTELK